MTNLLSKEQVNQEIEEICAKLENDGYDFVNNSTTAIKKAIRDEFFKNHAMNEVSRPLVIGSINSTVEKYINKQNDNDNDNTEVADVEDNDDPENVVQVEEKPKPQARRNVTQTVSKEPASPAPKGKRGGKSPSKPSAPAEPKRTARTARVGKTPTASSVGPNTNIQNNNSKDVNLNSIVNSKPTGRKRVGAGIKNKTDIIVEKNTKSSVSFPKVHLAGMNALFDNAPTNSYVIDPRTGPYSRDELYTDIYENDPKFVDGEGEIDVDKTIIEAEKQLVDFILDEETAAKYMDATEKYRAYVNGIREGKIKITVDGEQDKRSLQLPSTSKKSQNFTYVKTSKNVKFIDPMTEKVNHFGGDDALPFIEYQNTIAEIEKKWKEAISTKKFKPIDYLKLNVIHTHNILKYDKLKACYKNVLYENVSKLTNTFIVVEENEDDKLSQGDVSKFVPDYMELFVDLKKITGAQFQRVVKNIYMHRQGIISHKKCTHKFREEQWLQAFANIDALLNDAKENPNKYNPVEVNIFEAWQNILSSRYAFFIIMNGIPACGLFDKAFLELIQEGTSIKLFETALYPISFVFTPFMLGYNSMPYPGITEVNEVGYRKKLVDAMKLFGSIDEEYWKYDDCNWIYYGINARDGIENNMISLLHHVVASIPIIKQPGKGGKKKGNETETEAEDAQNTATQSEIEELVDTIPDGQQNENGDDGDDDNKEEENEDEQNEEDEDDQ